MFPISKGKLTLSAFAVSCLYSTTVLAAPCGFMTIDPFCILPHASRPAGFIQPASLKMSIFKSPLVSPPKSNNRNLSPNRVYQVKVRCSQNASIPSPAVDQLVTDNVAATMIIAISDTNSGIFPASDKAKALFTVYNVGGDITNRTSYINAACNQVFFLTSRTPLYLLANVSRIDTHVPGQSLKVIEGLMNVASAVLPMFAAVAPPAAALSALKGTPDMLNSFIALANKGTSPAPAYLLTEGSFVIKSDYARVTVNLSPLLSVYGLNNEYFTAKLEDALSDSFKGQFTPGVDPAKIPQLCLSAASIMKDSQALSLLDITFGLSFLGRHAGMQAPDLMRCLGDTYALTAAARVDQSAWNDTQKFDQKAVRTTLRNHLHTLPQPNFNDVLGDLETDLAYMNLFAKQQIDQKSDSTFSTAAKTVGLYNYIADAVKIEDTAFVLHEMEATPPTPGKPPQTFTLTNVEVMERFYKKNYRLFGCLVADNAGVADFLALPSSGSGKKGSYVYSDALLVRAWVDDDSRLAQLEIHGQSDVAATLGKRTSCGVGTNAITFTSPPTDSARNGQLAMQP